MKAFFVLATLFVTGFVQNSFGQVSAEMTQFLNLLPDKMSCKGTEVSFLTDQRKELTEKVTILITGKDTAKPMIEVKAPSASYNKHFKVGNGYSADLEQGGSYSYYFSKESNALYYVRVLNEGDSVDSLYLLQIRDSGGLVSFSDRRVCTNTFHCIEFRDCSPL